MLPSRGRPARPIIMTFDRPLTKADIYRLQTQPKAKAPIPAVQRLKASHQAAARYLAAGRSVKEVAILVGYTPQRVSDMQRNDPAFQELVTYYQNQVDELSIDEAARFKAKALIVGELALDEMKDRLEDDRQIKTIPFSELRALSGDIMDRTVLPKKSSAPTINMPEQVTFRIGDNDLRPKQLPGDNAKDITDAIPAKPEEKSDAPS